MRARPVQRRAAHAVGGIHLGAPLQQSLGHHPGVFHGREVERRLGAFVAQLDAERHVEERDHRARVLREDGDVEGRVAKLVRLANVCARAEQM
eukprot:5226988-Pyramimonas_sp.AAC.1